MNFFLKNRYRHKMVTNRLENCDGIVFPSQICDGFRIPSQICDRFVTDLLQTVIKKFIFIFEINCIIKI